MRKEQHGTFYSEVHAGPFYAQTSTLDFSYPKVNAGPFMIRGPHWTCYASQVNSRLFNDQKSMQDFLCSEGHAERSTLDPLDLADLTFKIKVTRGQMVNKGCTAGIAVIA